MASPNYQTVGFLDKDYSVSHVLITALLGVLIVLVWQCTRKSTIPVINSYAGDMTLKKAHAEFMSNARGLVKEGIQKVSWINSREEQHLTGIIQFKGPFRIITTLGSRVILPASYTEWLKNCPDLDHQGFVRHVR